MNIWPASKALAKRCILHSGALLCTNGFVTRSVAILMYHSVTDDPRRHAYSLGELSYSTAMFRKHMELIANNYHPVGLDDVLRFVNGDNSLPPRPVVVTFDDGYADNADVAAPVLNHFGIRGVFYVTVESVNTGTPPWFALLRYAFSTSKQTIWTDSTGMQWPLVSPEQRNRAFLAACETCARSTGTAQKKMVQALECKLDSSLSIQTERLMMTWAQARQLVRAGHIVGSHTMTHPNLAHVKDEEISLELAQSKEILERELAISALHFSYPGPSQRPHWNSRTVAFCRQAGYRSAVTTNSGPVRKGDDPLYLRRVPTAPDVHSLRWILECTFLGRSM